MVRHGRSLACACAVALSLEAEARADDVEDVSVRGSRATGFTSSAKESDSLREVTDAASLVEPLPGVHVRRLGADDGFATLSIRGASSSQVNVVLAGVPLSGGADPSVDLSSLPLWPSARARVFRSFSPAAYGQGSLGGTLTLDPPSPNDREATEAWAALGSFGAARLRVGVTRAIGGGARIVTGLSASRAQDDFSYYNPSHNPPTSDPAASLTRDNAGHADASALAGVTLPIRFSATRSGSLKAVTMLQGREQRLPGSLFHLTPNQRLSQDRELAGLEAAMGLGEGAAYARLWGRREGRSLRDAPATALDATRSDGTIVATGGALGWRGRPFSRVRVEALVDARGERYAPGMYEGPTPPTGASRAGAGVGADLEWAPIDALRLAASGRVDAWNDASSDRSIGARADARPTGHLGAELALGPLALAAHGGALARPPNFVERFGSAGGALATPDLRTEGALTFDVGARASGKAGPLKASLEIAGFGTWASDLITYVLVSARGVPKAENIAEARILGLEASAEARVYGLRLRAGYTGLATTNLSSCVSSSCPPLPGRPEHDLTADASYALGRMTLRYGLDAVTGIRADSAGTIVVPARVLQSAGVRVALGRFTFALDVRNLFDVRTGDYDQSFLGTTVPYPIGDAFYYPLPGRSFLVSARVHAD